MSVVVAVDGPAGSGKSSVSKAVARQLGFGYLDTGASYRVLTWLCLERGVDLTESQSVLDELVHWDYSPPLDPNHQVHSIGGVDVSEQIRSEAVSSRVSEVARHAEVRTALNEGFRVLARSAAYPGVIIEGRDITTVVAPDAPVRILLTASEEIRALRRERELTGAGRHVGSRDQQDSRVVDFLQAAPGVHTVDSSELTFDETVDAVLALVPRPDEEEKQ